MTSQNQNPNDQPLFPPAGTTTGEPVHLQPLEEGKTLADLRPGDAVISGVNDPDRPSRQIILSTQDVLTHDGKPLSEAADGSTGLLDPNRRIVKLGGEVIARVTK